MISKELASGPLKLNVLLQTNPSSTTLISANLIREVVLVFSKMEVTELLNVMAVGA